MSEPVAMKDQELMGLVSEVHRGIYDEVQAGYVRGQQRHQALIRKSETCHMLGKTQKYIDSTPKDCVIKHEKE